MIRKCIPPRVATTPRQAFASALVAAGLLIGATAHPAQVRATDFKNTLSDAALIDALKSGGYVIFIRHATTEKDYADQVSAVMGDCSTQRVLSEAGWQEAKDIGAAFTVHNIPIGAVYSSQYCRAWQTADLAFGRYIQNASLNFEPAEEYTEAQTAAMRDRMMPLLSKAPAEGFNTVVVGHDDPFEAATGIYPDPMGVTFVLKPDGQGAFRIIAKVEPDGWF
ncbi:MAG: histidine phosphatase family protein [Rhodospirillales bacterium]|nr:histidine phosphatase family protein [Rhodospirillales bacterium]